MSNILSNFVQLFHSLRKLWTFNSHELEDYISKLPDDVMSSIVSQFPLKEVARYSVLSHRWRYLWRLTDRLEFESDWEIRDKVMLDEADKLNFVNWVNWVLESHSNSKVELVRIRYGLDKHFKSDLDRWLQFVFAKQVENLELELLPQFTSPRNKYTLCCQIFSKSEEAPGDCVVDSQFIGFLSLKSLRLSGVNLSDELVTFLLDNCPALERLFICDSSSLVNFKCINHPALRFLELRCNLETIEISNVKNLVSFVCDTNPTEPKLVLEKVPSLVSLHLSNSIARSYLNSGLNDQIAQLSSSLKSLKLHIPFYWKYTDIGRLPKLDLLPKLLALEELVVQISESNNIIFWYFILIEMCPNLQKFEFQRGWTKKMYPPTSANNCRFGVVRFINVPPHECLKEVKLAGYYGCDTEIMSAFYFFDHAKALEKVIIDPHNQKRIMYGRPQKHHETRKEQAARRRAKRELQGREPQGIQLVIL